MVTMENNAEEILSRENGQQHGEQHGEQQQQQTTLKSKLITSARVALVASLVLHLAMLVVGILGVRKCPAGENVPLFLVATGVMGLLSKLLTATRDYVSAHSRIKLTLLESSLYSGEIVFFILGSYWVFKIYPPNYDPAAADYCDRSTYLFAFVYLCVLGGLLLTVIAGFVFFLLCACWLTRMSEDDDAHARDLETGQ